MTADDVAFTIHVLQDPAYTGPGAGSWNEVTVDTDGARTVVFTLATPLGGFLQAATQPIAPAHLLAGVPVAGLADLAVRPPADRLRAVRRRQPRCRHRRADPGRDGPRPPGGIRRARTDRPIRSRHRPSTERPAGEPIPYLPGIEFQFYDDPDALAAAYRAGSLDAASGLSPELTRELATAPDSRAAPLSGLDADHRAPQPPPRPSGVHRSGGPWRPAGRDRPADPGPGRLLDGRRAGDQPDPAVVGPVRPRRRRARPVRPGRGGGRAQEGRLDAGRRRLAPAKGEGSRRHRAPQPGPGVEPGRLRDGRGGGARVEGDRDRGPPRRARRRGRSSTSASRPASSPRPSPT